MPIDSIAPLTLQQFTSEIASAIRCNPMLHSCWITAELSDLSVRGGHCYMELIEKDERGATVAKMRATIWANNFLYKIKPKFERATGQSLASGMKVMIQGSATFHEQYGLSFNISDIDPTFTLGDMARIRREIILQLTKEGVIDCNKNLDMPLAPQRIAVISASNAAGYGDFMNQLESNKQGYIFYTYLFESVMQGERTASSIISALQKIEMTIDLWDCVVIVRGGGSTSDLNGFDNLELARAVASFPLPIVAGIGHERDFTVIDEIVNVRVKTPTAAAEWLIEQADALYIRISSLADSTMRIANEHLSGAKQQLAQLQSALPAMIRERMVRANSAISSIASALPHIAGNKIIQHRSELKNISQQISISASQVVAKQSGEIDMLKQRMTDMLSRNMMQASQKVEGLERLVAALHPINTMRRGYSITRVDGKAVRSVSDVAPGATIVTSIADGDIISTVNNNQ